MTTLFYLLGGFLGLAGVDVAASLLRDNDRCDECPECGAASDGLCEDCYRDIGVGD